MSDSYPDTYQITERGDGMFVIEKLYKGFNQTDMRAWSEVKKLSTTNLYRFNSLEEAKAVLNCELDFIERGRNLTQSEQEHEKAKEKIVAKHPFVRESKLSRAP